MSEQTGGFTLPGEAGYEKLTLELAKCWGADRIRDSDGTALSPELLEAGYGIYSTICTIRGHNAWLKQHPRCLQQTFLMSEPVIAEAEPLIIDPMDSFFREQFQPNVTEAGLPYWQVCDRTEETFLPRDCWNVDPITGLVTIPAPKRWHRYTVNFLAYRIWEEISMYNHVTNHWEKEHLMPLDPAYPEAAAYLKEWLTAWCRQHPHTTVVRFTSLFYNFAWIWGSDEARRNLFTDWASYDFTVSDAALEGFRKAYGYTMTAEDFINQGKRHPTHRPPDPKMLDWMEYIGRFVRTLGKELVGIVHQFGKQALLFFDDSWVGTEPNEASFREFGFDGIIKCAFSAYEVRLCTSVDTPLHELRLHPYLFPTGVDGSPSFLEGGDPAGEAQRYWMQIRRGLLRTPVDRIGLGGYLHLVERKPEFVSYITSLAEEFRAIRALHRHGSPATLRPKVAILHCWGSLRPWTLSGHFHETYRHDLIHLNECLAGLPLDVKFIDFQQVVGENLTRYQVIINAGAMGTAWSGGAYWKTPGVVEAITAFVAQGGVFFGVHEPSAVTGLDTTLAMAHVLGVDVDQGEFVCHGRRSFSVDRALADYLLPEGICIEKKSEVFLTDAATTVLAAQGDTPLVCLHPFGKGMGVYLASFQKSWENNRMLLNLILYACGEDLKQPGVPDNPYVESAWFPGCRTIALLNGTSQDQTTSFYVEGKQSTVEIPAFGSLTLEY